MKSTAAGNVLFWGGGGFSFEWVSHPSPICAHYVDEQDRPPGVTPNR